MHVTTLNTKLYDFFRYVNNKRLFLKVTTKDQTTIVLILLKKNIL